VVYRKSLIAKKKSPSDDRVKEESFKEFISEQVAFELFLVN
jgi:hypothetical protein